MELLMISFAAAWMLRAWWDGRRADYRDNDNGYQQCVGRREPRRSGPDTRYAMGWSAFQLRHGWPAMVEDVRRGYNDAQTSYKRWQEGDETERHGMWDAWKRGWRQASKKLPKTRRQQAAAAEKAAADEATRKQEAPAAEKTPSIPTPASPNGAQFGAPTIGGSMTAPTGETTSITAYRQHLQHTLDQATERMESASTSIRNAEAEIAAHENSYATLGAAGMGSETTGDMAGLIEAALDRKQSAERSLAAAEKTRADAEQALRNLDTQGHTTIEEGVKGATAKVADTSFYKN